MGTAIDIAGRDADLLVAKAGALQLGDGFLSLPAVVKHSNQDVSLNRIHEQAPSVFFVSMVLLVIRLDVPVLATSWNMRLRRCKGYAAPPGCRPFGTNLLYSSVFWRCMHTA